MSMFHQRLGEIPVSAHEYSKPSLLFPQMHEEESIAGKNAVEDLRCGPGDRQLRRSPAYHHGYEKGRAHNTAVCT